jgi:hypothetical protein
MEVGEPAGTKPLKLFCASGTSGKNRLKVKGFPPKADPPLAERLKAQAKTLNLKSRLESN